MCTDIYSFTGKESLLEKEIMDELTIKRQTMLDLMISQPSSESLIDAIMDYLKSVNKNIISKTQVSKAFETEKVRWRSVLSSGIRMTIRSDNVEKPMIKGNFLYWEIFCCYLLIAYSLFNQASKKGGSGIGSSLGEAQINQSVDLYCRAAGVFQFINTFYSFRCRSSMSSSGGGSGSSGKSVSSLFGGASSSPSFSPEIAIMSALTDLSLAEAQLLCIQKAQKRSVSTVNLIKLYAALVDKYNCCLENMKREKNAWQELSSLFKDHVEGSYLNYKTICLFEYGKYQAEEKSKHGTGAVCMAEVYNLLLKLTKNQQWTGKASDNISERMTMARNLQESYTKLNVRN